MKTTYDKFKKYGADSLSNLELLSLITGNKDSAIKALDRFGSFREMGKENYQAITHLTKIAKKEAERIHLCLEMSRRYSIEKCREKAVITSPEKAAAYISPFLRDLRHEEFFVMFLNSGKCVESHLLLSKGGSNATIVDVKKVVKEAIVREANSIILAHNHPSGTMRASSADISLTNNIVEALKPLSINVDDHIIIAMDDYLSFRYKNLIKGF